MKVPLMAGWTALALIATGFSQDKATLITQFRSAAEAEVQARESSPDAKDPDKSAVAVQSFKRAVSQLKLLSPDAPAATLAQAIAAIHSTTSNPATRKAAEDLNAFLQKAIADRKEKARVNLEAAAKRAAEIGFSAKTSKELDAPISELTELMGETSRAFASGRVDDPYSISLTPDTIRVQPLLAWLQNRQEFLIHLEAGNRQAAKQVLQRSTGTNANLSLWIPRSQLLAQQAADLNAASPEEAVKDARAQIERILEISRQVLATEDPKTIDPLVEQLSRFERSGYSGSSGDDGYELQATAKGAREFARRWQDFLIARSAGDHEAARRILAQLTSDGRDYPGVPRSEMLAKAYGEKAQSGDGKSKAGAPLLSPQQILAQITNLDELERLLPELQSAVRSTSSYEQQFSISSLQEIARAYREFKAGNATRVLLNLSGMGPYDGPVNKLRNDLALLVLPSLIGVAETDHPKTGETPLTYLRRMLSVARERKDWLLALRIINTAQSTNVNDPLLRSNDSTAITQFISGVTLEKGKQYALAVNAYQLALKAGSEVIPAEDIGSRLEEIKKSHPEAYKEGSELTMTPPVSRSAYPPGTRTPYPPGFMTPPAPPSGEQPVVVPARPQKAPTSAPPAEKPAEIAAEAKPAEKGAEPKPATAP